MLLDHFHPPISDQFGWQGFHTQWAAALTADLNLRLPEGWRAQSNVRFGIEVDVGVLDEQEAFQGIGISGEPWEPPAPLKTVELALVTDIVEVSVVNYSYSPSLVGAIELVSPANKDRPDHRDAFVSKCMAILTQGAGLIMVDIVTERRANLHSALMNRLGERSEPTEMSPYASAYHPARGSHEGWSQLQIWEGALEVGQPLPTLPLFLRVGPMLPVDLNATYDRACQESRITAASAVTQSDD